MNIVFSTDNKYVPYCGISIISLLENNKGEDIHIYIIGDNITIDSKEALYRIAKKYDVNIDILDMDNRLIEKCPPILPHQSKFISLTTYIRLFFVTILPASLEKILYLDCDIIVEQNIKSLWDTDITDYSVAGITDIMAEEKRFEGYVNAGILLINLDYWRKNKIQDKFVEYINGDNKLDYHDQDTINHVLRDTIKYLPMKYNVQTCFYDSPESYSQHHSEMDEALKHTIILHFTGPKPWWKDLFHSKKEVYRYYATKSEWKWKDISVWSPFIDNKFRRKFRFYKKKFLSKFS